MSFLLICIFVVVLVVNHVVALRRVTSGRLTVFSGWCDFFVAAIWPFAIVFAMWTWVGWSINHEKYMGLACLSLSVVSGVSVFWLMLGTFLICERSVINFLIAILARFSSSILAIFLISKVLTIFQEMSRGTKRALPGLVAFTALAGIFAILVVPMVPESRSP